MIDHDEARGLAGAVADGELPATPDLDAHLASCAECAAFVTGLARLSVLTAALPREHAPATLASRVLVRVRKRRWRVRLALLAPAVAAATALVVLVSVLPGPGGRPSLVPLPPAAAAERLLSLRSLYVERTVVAGEFTTHERIWWKAPGYVRIERADTLTIQTPFLLYIEGHYVTNAVPSIALPEPLSPTVALFGRDIGPGPVVAGQPTRTYRLTIGDQTRTAYVAAGIGLGGRETVVLEKTGGPAVKTTQVLKVDPDIPDSLFVPPGTPNRDDRFRTRPLGDLAIEPYHLPEGFTVVRSGTGPDGGDAALLVRGSLPVLVRSGGLRAEQFSEPRLVDGLLAQVALYGVPEVQLTTPRGVVTVSAPLPLDSLVRLAVAMYGE